MKSPIRISVATSLAAISLSLAAMGGCKTNEVGVTNTLGTYAINVDVSPERATEASEKALKQLSLLQVSSSHTSIDGHVTAKTAQNDDVIVNIEQAGSNVSKVSVRVGAAGDSALSSRILDKIKGNLHWFR